ncbi:unnamed protein product [Euphydryas editha]|uniref:Uncharacterized protein n=1 Tax=Euphydryas editha TaxID=104508 RepID=A0AAU9TUJ9_EUPED|nr:unnamed protein product [Euphydryas editha]
MEIPCQKWEIEHANRIGKNTGKIRPVVVTITTTSRKIEILKKKKSLDGTNIYLKEDFPPNVLQKRKELQEDLKRERESRKRVILRYDRIVTLKTRESEIRTPTKRNINKRLMSISPEEAVKETGTESNNERTKQQKRSIRQSTFEKFIEKTGAVRKAYKELSVKSEWTEKLKNKQGIIQSRRPDIINVATKFYETLYTATDSTFSFPGTKSNEYNEANANAETPIILSSEIEHAIKSQKNDKTPGSDNITNETLKILSDLLLKPLQDNEDSRRTPTARASRFPQMLFDYGPYTSCNASN